MTNFSAEKTREQIRRLIAPASIAIVGASADLERFNGRVVKNLLRHGYGGKTYPVNPKYDEVAGLRCYPSLKELPGVPETVFISVGRDRVLGIVEECAELGVPGVTIYTGGFSEVDEEGGRIEEAIARVAQGAGMRVCGPNTAGHHNFGGRVQLAGIIAMEVEALVPGAVGMICQSGSIGGALISRAAHRGIGFSHLFSCGNEMDLEMADYLDFLVEDEATRSIAIYMEGLKSPGKFMQAAERAVEAGKPITVCKVGRTAAGRAAAISHTGAMVGEDRAYEAAFKQLGITRVPGLESLYEVAHMFAVTPRPRGRRVGVLSTSGGAGALVADECGAMGLEVPPMDEKLGEKILGVLPDFIGVGNPIDTTIAGIDSFEKILEVLLKEGAFDILPLVVGSSAQFRHQIAVDPIVRAKEAGRAGGLPLLAYFNPHAEEAHRKMAAAGIPSFNTTEGAARSAGYLVRYAEFAGRRRREEKPPAAVEIPEAARGIIEKGEIGEADGLALAEAFGIRAAPHRLCADLDEAAWAAGALGYPVVLKVSSPEVRHKTEMGLVEVGLGDEEALGEAFGRLSGNLERAGLARGGLGEIDGYLVQKMIRGGEEFMLGMVQDIDFGSIIAVGLGGAAAEATGDVNVRHVALNRGEAGAMLDELRAAPLLGPFRGRGPLDREALIEAICRFAAMCRALGDGLIEMDLNPLIVMPGGGGVYAADALVRLGGGPS